MNVIVKRYYNTGEVVPMIIAFISLLILSAVTFAAVDRSKVSMWSCGYISGLPHKHAGMFFNLCKNRWFTRTIEHLFFITDKFRLRFAFAPMSFDNISRMLIMGRVIFIISYCY